MTKKHYEAIARILNEAYTADSDKGIIMDIAIPLADYFEQDNPRFQRTRFLATCGIEEDVCKKCGTEHKDAYESLCYDCAMKE